MAGYSACKKLARKTRDLINKCALRKNPNKRLLCARNIKQKFEKGLRRAGNCGDLKDRMSRYADRRGIGGAGKPGPSKHAKAGPRSHGPIKVDGRQKAKCRAFFIWAKGAFRYCMKQKDLRRLRPVE